MALITKEWLSNDAVDGTKLKLENDQYLRGRNNADSADINIIKVNTSDKLEFASVPQVTSDPSADNDLVRKSYVVTQLGSYQATSEKGSASGYCPLDASSKVATTYLPDTVLGAVDYQGTWDADGNSPDLPAASPTKGDYYVVSTAGSTSLGGITDWEIGDWAIYNGSSWEKVDNTDNITSVNSQTGTVVLDADDISDTSTTNKFVTAAGVTKLGHITVTQAVDLDTMESGISGNTTNISTNAGDIDDLEAALGTTTGLAGMDYTSTNYVTVDTTAIAAISALDSQVKTNADAIAAATSADAEFEVKTLDGTDISNGYVDLGNEALVDSLLVWPVNGPIQTPTVDYTISYTGGAGSVTRVTFAGDLSTNLSSGEKLALKYLKA